LNTLIKVNTEKKLLYCVTQKMGNSEYQTSKNHDVEEESKQNLKIIWVINIPLLQTS